MTTSSNTTTFEFTLNLDPGWYDWLENPPQCYTIVPDHALLLLKFQVQQWLEQKGLGAL